jgi:hypothetical protein
VRRCEECGFDWDAGPDVVIASIASAGARFTDALAPFDDRRVRARPAPDVWSPLEYTAHTREVLVFYDERVRRVATEDGPQLTAYGFAHAADRDAYNAEIVVFSLEGLTAAADRFAARLRELPADAWSRVGTGSEGDERALLRLARSGGHEVEHHLLDVLRQQQQPA